MWEFLPCLHVRCGKLLRSEAEVQRHAAHTQHLNFSESTEEIKPLTEEEKKEQAQKWERERVNIIFIISFIRLQEKIKQRRTERETKEKDEEKKREQVRRKTGQELTQIKHEMEMKEAMKIAEQKRREKMEEKLARYAHPPDDTLAWRYFSRKKVLDDIARDRANRAERDRAEKQAAQPTQNNTTSTPTPVAQPKKEYDSCKLQVCKQPLVYVFEWGCNMKSTKGTVIPDVLIL